jgi:eukaryotic-like serine/threonine-protein kinase
VSGQPNASAPNLPEPGREEAIFDAAIALPPDQRAGYLARACGDDSPLRQRIQALLQANQRAGSFLEPARPSTGPEPTLVVSVPLTEKPGDVIGHYKIREKLGEGGCGAVYVAEQAEPVRRRVALKIIKLGMDTRSVIARFEAERQSLAMMDHPNIAKVLDAGTTETGRPFFVMELVRGIRITDYCDQNNLGTRQRLELFIQVCHAIQHAHQKGVIHRDIKPSNILVTLHDGVPVPKVIDFGIAKATEGRLTDLTVYTELHQFIGTPAYMSPEQAEMSGLDVDTRSDIYSLGVLLYELLIGRTPFDPQELLKSGLDQMRRTIREQEPLRPSTRLSTMLEADLTSVAKRHSAEAPRLVHFIRGDLDWIVMKSLEKDRTRRYDTANALAADVRRFLTNEAIEARPPSGLYRFQKLVRRNRTVFVAAGAVVAALALGFGLSLYLYLRESGLRAQAERGWALEKHLNEVAPVAEALTSAGYLLSQGDFAAAENLMAPLPPIVPASSAIYNVIGDHHAGRKQWPAAITNYLRSIQAGPENHLAYHLLTPALLQAGDLAAYSQHRQRILQRFANTTDPLVAERLARDCLFLPASPGEMEMINRMADRAVAAGSSAGGWARLAKGLAEFRQGRLESAVKWLDEAEAQSADPALKLQADMVLAMTQYRLNQVDAARATLAKGRAFEASNALDREGIGWNDRRSAYLLMDEARTLIPKRSSSDGDP